MSRYGRIRYRRDLKGEDCRILKDGNPVMKDVKFLTLCNNQVFMVLHGIRDDESVITFVHQESMISMVCFIVSSLASMIQKFCPRSVHGLGSDISFTEQVSERLVSDCKPSERPPHVVLRHDSFYVIQRVTFKYVTFVNQVTLVLRLIWEVRDVHTTVVDKEISLEDFL